MLSKNDIIYFGALQILTHHDYPYYTEGDFNRAVTFATKMYDKIYTKNE